MPEVLGLEIGIDREIRLNKDYQRRRSSWSLQEFDSEGEKCGDDLIPWDMIETFSASEVHLTQSIKKNRETGLVTESEGINGKLHPGWVREGVLEQRTPYFMMGTSRRIEQFHLGIETVGEQFNKEECYLWGGIGHRDYWTWAASEDQAGITIFLNPERYRKLAGIVKAQRVSRATVSLRNVPGFYAPYSGPDGFADYIKVLADDDADQKVILPESCEIDPPRLGKVEEFELSIWQGNRIDLGIKD